MHATLLSNTACSSRALAAKRPSTQCRAQSQSAHPMTSPTTAQPSTTSDAPRSRNPAVHEALITEHLASSAKLLVGAGAALSCVHFAMNPATRVATLTSAIHSLSLVWFGGTAVINFMEAPVKFQAPSLTRTAGLDVGRHVFSALNKLEIPAACTLAYAAALGATGRAGPWALVPVACMAAETVWLLPSLFSRARDIIARKPVPKSHIHATAALSSVVKLGALLAVAWLTRAPPRLV